MSNPPLTRTREWLPLAWLAPLFVAIFAGAATARWHSSTSVDNRTYLEMIEGISRHGLPYLANGPVERFPELQARWNLVRGGRLWGALPPVFPYVAVPVYRLGGVRAVVQFNIALLAVLALGAYALGRRVTRSPRLGVATAYVAIASAPVWTSSFDTSPYSLAITSMTWASYCGLVALETGPPRSHRYAFAAGALAALATGTHLLAFTMLTGLILGLALLPVDDSPPLVDPARLPAWLRAWTPTRGSLARGAWATLGAAVPFAPVAWLNHLRFGSWNPITYGPCVWRSCAETGLDKQGIGQMLVYVAPVLAWAALTVALLWLVRRSRYALAVVGGIALVALVPPSVLHTRAFGLASTAWGFLVDVSNLEMGHGFAKPPDELGNFLGPFVVKSTLQCTPAFALALLARPRDDRERRAVALLALPCIALYASLVLRANLPAAFALGYPFLNLRYVIPAAPAMAGLALLAVRDLPWKRGYLALVALTAAGVGGWIVRMPDDNPYARRVLLLRVTLVVALAAFVLVVRARGEGRGGWRRAAVLASAVAFGLGFAVTLGVDLKNLVQLRNEGDRVVDRIARLTPPRFALVGWPPQIDPVLALRATRDVEYADLYESQNWANFRTLIDVWTEQRRPIYAVFPTHIVFNSPWHDVRFEILDRQLGLYRITRTH